MAGNRKHGYLRGNRGGFRGEPWFCHGCQKLHPYRQERNGTLDGRWLCNKRDREEMAERSKAAHAVKIAAVQKGGSKPKRVQHEPLLNGTRNRRPLAAPAPHHKTAAP
jgi:hypothetical protein